MQATGYGRWPHVLLQGRGRPRGRHQPRTTFAFTVERWNGSRWSGPLTAWQYATVTARSNSEGSSIASVNLDIYNTDLGKRWFISGPRYSKWYYKGALIWEPHPQSGQCWRRLRERSRRRDRRPRCADAGDEVAHRHDEHDEPQRECDGCVEPPAVSEDRKTDQIDHRQRRYEHCGDT
jgi:hypothetical protein